MCSTPFGIIGIHTRLLSVRVRPGQCAQRLSASSEFTPKDGSDCFSVVELCSTPFGIIGIHTKDLQRLKA